MTKQERCDLKRRTTQFAIRVIRLVGAFPRNMTADVLARQVLKSGTSIGANYREAMYATSRRHFASILQIALRETEETMYWLELIVEAGIFNAARLKPLMSECNELTAIFVSSIRTARSKLPKPSKARAGTQ